MATWLKPELLLLDEHTSALDPKSGDQVITPSDEVIVRDKLTTLMVTHSSVSDRIRVVITDDAPAYDPLAREEVDTSIPLEDRAIGGLGVHLVKNHMNVSLYERIDGKNILTIEGRLNAIDRPV